MTFVRFAAVLSLAACVAAPALAQTAPAPVAAAPSAPQVAPAGDTIETLRAAGQFKTLLKALDAAQLTALIKGQRSLTLFAPTDGAFAAMPAGELDRLMKDPPALQAFLVYHLINLPVDSSKIAGARGPITTVSGVGVVLDGMDGALKANDANIVQADIRTPNGIIHVVDRVLKPETGAAITQRLKEEDAAAQAQSEAGAAPAE